MAQEQTALVGEPIEVLVNVIGSAGTHEAATINTTTTRIEGYPATAPTVTTIATGIYKISFSGVTPAPAEGDRLTVKINGTVTSTSTAWSEYGIPVKILAEERGTDNASTFNSASDQVTVSTNNDKSGYSISGTKQTLDDLNDIAATDIVTAGAITTLNGAVANVDLCDVTTTNTDMRGTDNALTTASLPANFASLGINASGHIDRVTLVDVTTANTDQRGTDNAFLAASAPSNFGNLGINGAGDISRVTLVDTVTSNADMRGTDGANTVAPDNTGIAANGTAISNLNDINATDVENAVWNAPTASHVQAGTFGKLMDILKKANRAIDAEVAGTPTASAFDTNLAGYTDGAFDHELLVFTSGSLIGEARPILSYSSTNGRITFEEALTGAPAAADEFVILPYHTTPTSEIQDGLARTTDLATVTKTGVQYTATAQSGDTIQVTLS